MNAFTKKLLTALYFKQYDNITDENIDWFYCFLGFDLELAADVEQNIQNTSTLRQIIETTAKEMEYI